MKNINFIILALFPLLILACHSEKEVNKRINEPVRIAISKAVPYDSYQNYVRWIKYADSLVEYVDMYHLEYDSAMLLLQSCDGLILTGGTDVFPGRYGKIDDTSRCWKPDFKRDTMEVRLLRTALENDIPVMGICRGLQIINVELGGQLYIDLPSDLDTVIKHQVPHSYEALHEVTIVENSLLHQISAIEAGFTNSNHHQGIELLAPGLQAIGFTGDGLIESIQLIDDPDQFLLGVQWHPERMEYSSPLSGKIAKRFIKESLNHKQRRLEE